MPKERETHDQFSEPDVRARPVVFRSEDLTLEGELVIPEGARAALVLCHGIPGGLVPDPADPGYAGLARHLAGRGYAALWFNFRGCRGAPGDFSFRGWCADLDAALDALAAHPDAAGLPRAVVGSSAGGAAAIVVGARRPDVAAVATLAAVASFRFGPLAEDLDALLGQFRNLGIIRDPAFPPDRDAWREEFATHAAQSRVRDISPRPLLLVHGDADDVVPYAHAERLFEQAGEPKELVRIPGGTHQLRKDPRALDALVDWLDRRLAQPRQAHRPD